MILLAGFAMAVTLLVLAVVINSAIATENLGTRSDVASTSEAVTYQGAVERGALEALRYANEVNGSDEHDELVANFTTAVEAVSTLSARQQVTRGYVPNASVVDTVEGTAIRDETGDFTGPGGSNWSVADPVSEVRWFSLYVDEWNSTSPHEFRVVASNPSEWYVNISRTGGEYEVGVNRSGVYESCYSGPSADFWVNVSAGTVAGSPCPALDLDLSPTGEDLLFRNGSAIGEGRYSLVVDRSVESRYGTDPGEPRADPVLYSATVDLRYRSPDLYYRTSLGIEPGESDG